MFGWQFPAVGMAPVVKKGLFAVPRKSLIMRGPELTFTNAPKAAGFGTLREDNFVSRHPVCGAFVLAGVDERLRKETPAMRNY